MRDIRRNRLSDSSENENSFDSGFGSYLSGRHSRRSSSVSHEEKEVQAAFESAHEGHWRMQYHRHNERGLAKCPIATVSIYTNLLIDDLTENNP